MATPAWRKSVWVKKKILKIDLGKTSLNNLLRQTCYNMALMLCSLVYFVRFSDQISLMEGYFVKRRGIKLQVNYQS